MLSKFKKLRITDRKQSNSIVCLIVIMMLDSFESIFFLHFVGHIWNLNSYFQYYQITCNLFETKMEI